MPLPLQRDDQGQPPRWIYRERVGARLIAELLGVCKGLICDGIISEAETDGLRRWMRGHPDATVGYPGQPIAERLVKAYADGRIDPDERAELYEIMLSITGETPEHDLDLNRTSLSFFTQPEPTVIFDAHEFVFTGKLMHGPRGVCERAVADRGGRTADYVSSHTDYLVVGPVASAAWLQGTYGTKLEAAAELVDRGHALYVVTEAHWRTALDLPAP